jgi:ribonuclease-3
VTGGARLRRVRVADESAAGILPPARLPTAHSEPSSGPPGKESQASLPESPPHDLDELQQRVEHSFARRELLEEALIHPSALAAGADNGAGADFNRLEFLGDRILGVVVAEELLERNREEGAGLLALRFNALVRRESCAEVAAELGLGRYLRMANSERAAGGEEKPAILADACEALIAAIYLDGGFEAARRFVRRHWALLMDEKVGAAKDAKTELQEWAHRMTFQPPEYRLVETEGPPHQPVFTVEVEVPGGGSAIGRGSTKRVAEQEAAAMLLQGVGEF